ncbi:MAG: cytochrome c oxidase subunit II [Ilumatobacteraceae bacterium]
MSRIPTRLRPAAVAATVIVAVGLLAGCSDSTFSQPDAASEQGEHTLALWRIFIVVGAAVGAIVLGLILYVTIKFRRRSDEIPSQKANNVGWEAVYTITPIVIVAVLFTLSVTTQNKTEKHAANPDLTINVIGFQWGWQFEYPEQGVLVTGSGSAGERPTLVLPVGKTVHLVLRTVDVIHSFWVPEFLDKRDLIPGLDNSLDVTPNHVGTYDGKCAEFCLLDHWRMTFIVEVVTPEAFDSELSKAVTATQGGPP